MNAQAYVITHEQLQTIITQVVYLPFHQAAPLIELMARLPLFKPSDAPSEPPVEPLKDVTPVN